MKLKKKEREIGNHQCGTEAYLLFYISTHINLTEGPIFFVIILFRCAKLKFTAELKKSHRKASL